MSGLHLCRHPLAQHRLARLRDRGTRPAEFRALVRELGVLLAIEATADLRTRPCTVHTPLAPSGGLQLDEGVALIPILRAGLGMVEGVASLLPDAEIWHLGLRRDEHTLEPVKYYELPRRPPQRLCLVLDPMLATGGSAAAAIAALRERGVRRIKFLGILGAPEGLASLQAAAPELDIHLVALDERLDEHGFIVPGLGDAGDRQFGTL
jgi:uracil phosphoribosyltransferase